jgi:hypothetical protein
MNTPRCGVGLLALLLLAISFVTTGSSVAGASTGGGTNAAYCRDAQDLESFNPTSLHEWKLGLTSLKTIDREAPSSLKGNIGKFVTDVELIIKQNGKYTRAQAKSFAKVDNQIGSQTSVVCAAWLKSHG